MHFKTSYSFEFTFQYGATSTEKDLNNKNEHSIFTFQYGATSTCNRVKVSGIFLSFTFQYGATSTYYKCLSIQNYQNLHSNMVLLLQKMKSFINTYINVFTFQYGATSTLGT